MGKPPYDDPDTLDLMRADADQVSLVETSALVAADGATAPDGSVSSSCVTATEADLDGFAVPADAVTLCGELHFHLD